MQKGGFATFLNNFVAKKVIEVEDNSQHAQGSTCSGSLYDEVEAYLRLPQIPIQDSSRHDKNILSWWRDT